MPPTRNPFKRYFNKRYHPPGTAPGTLTEPAEPAARPLRISVIDYSPDVLEEYPEIEAADCRRFLDSPHITWIHVQGTPDKATLQALAKLLDLHPLAVEDVATGSQRPKLELYDEQFFVTLGLPILTENHADSEQVSLFMGAAYVISFHGGESDPFGPVRKRLRVRNSRLRTRSADYLLYALIDLVIDLGFPVLENFGEQIETLEIELLDNPDRDTLNQIHRAKRDLLLLRRIVWPQRELINQLLREESPLLQSETKLYLRDCYDHSIEVIELLETYRDMTAGMLDVYLSSTSHRLNEIIRLLTLISTIFIPLTFIAGVYGMNFGRDTDKSPWAMPELDWYYGYPLIWLVMIAIGIAMALYFKHKRWF